MAETVRQVQSQSSGPERSGPVTVEEIIVAELERARKAYEPISRRMMAIAVAEHKKITYREAFDLVDAYCDEKEPAVPGYVSSEFGIFYLKVIAVLNVLVGMFLAYFGVKAFQNPRAPGMPYWAWFVLTTLFVGFAALSWVKSVERELGSARKN